MDSWASESEQVKRENNIFYISLSVQVEMEISKKTTTTSKKKTKKLKILSEIVIQRNGTEERINCAGGSIQSMRQINMNH